MTKRKIKYDPTAQGRAAAETPRAAKRRTRDATDAVTADAVTADAVTADAAEPSADTTPGSPAMIVAPPSPDAVLTPPPAPEPAVAPRVARTLRQRAELRDGFVELLTFRVGTELFGIELGAVEEVVDLPELHRVPEMPENLLGVFPLRGTLVPLYTPDATLGASLDRPASALVFRARDRRLALAVDDVDDVLTLALPALRDVPVTDAGDGVLAGVAHRERDLIGVLDVDALLPQLRAGHALETP